MTITEPFRTDVIILDDDGMSQRLLPGMLPYSLSKRPPPFFGPSIASAHGRLLGEYGIILIQ